MQILVFNFFFPPPHSGRSYKDLWASGVTSPPNEGRVAPGLEPIIQELTGWSDSTGIM